MVYNPSVIEIVETEAFQRWMGRLTDAVARTRILARAAAQDEDETVAAAGEIDPVAGTAIHTHFCDTATDGFPIAEVTQRSPPEA